MEPHPKKHKSLRLVAIVVGVILPSLVTYMYFHLLADSPAKLQQGVYSIGKAIQFGFPIVWILFVLREKLRNTGLTLLKRVRPANDHWPKGRSIALGITMGLAVAAAMFAIYRFAFSESVTAELSTQLVERVRGFSVDTWPKYLALTLFYTVMHSFLEEYYYRWFLFGQLRHVTKLVPAIVISGLAFMAHHVIVLAHYFGGLSPVTILLSLSIAVGGMIWAWQYEKSGSLVGPWLSHLLVDAGIFAIGYHVLTQAGAFA